MAETREYTPDSQPILPGKGATDYERYLRTDELLSLQKTPAEMFHRDELLFQTVHQSTELWLKLAAWEVEGAIECMRYRRLGEAIRMLHRATDCVDLITHQLHMMEHMSPWDYQSIRRGLGHGSGFGSPGFNRINELPPKLWDAFESLLKEQGLGVVELYQRGPEFAELFQLAELLIKWDGRVTLWRLHHFKVVERVIGGAVVGTAGTPIEVLNRILHKRRFPALWDARNELTGIAKWTEGQSNSTPPVPAGGVHVDGGPGAA